MVFSLFLFPEITTLTGLKIISGGQTGADRAALDFAIKHQIAVGGWCPKGRRAEDGIIDKRYPLSETNSRSYPIRTLKNIETSEGTLIIYLQKFDAGTGLTLKLCKKLNKPHLVVKLSESANKHTLLNWINENKISVLNVAGPRESSENGIYKDVFRYLEISFNYASGGLYR